MILRYIIILITLYTLGCTRSTDTIASDQKSYTLPEGDAIQAFEFLSLQIDEIRNGQSIKDAPNNAGYAPVAWTNRRWQPLLNDQEWLEYCGSMIFNYLGSPVDNNENTFVRIGDKPNMFVISHNKEAIRKFDQLLKKWIIDNQSKYQVYLTYPRVYGPKNNKANKAQ